ncbi:MAG: hypothetical protein IT289_08250 [Oligoflexia bacterium]|nr:hypothetical protein [Oligoflexia bacterium]
MKQTLVLALSMLFVITGHADSKIIKTPCYTLAQSMRELEVEISSRNTSSDSLVGYGEIIGSASGRLSYPELGDSGLIIIDDVRATKLANEEFPHVSAVFEPDSRHSLTDSIIGQMEYGYVYIAVDAACAKGDIDFRTPKGRVLNRLIRDGIVKNAQLRILEWESANLP